MTREITYCEAINEAITQEMERDKSIFVYGIGVPDHKKIFESVEGLEKFGSDRFFDTPICEDGLMGFGIGAAINGLRPIYVHIRVDFLALALNQLTNIAACIHSYSGGKLSVPMVIRTIVGRGWGQGAQHSKSIQSVFAHFPGIKVIMPTSPYDAKGLTISAIRDNNPVVVIEHRWFYWRKGIVPVESYEIPIGSCNVVREGKDATIVATSWMVAEAIQAASILSRNGIEIEVVDARSANPLDDSVIIESTNKTGVCLVADNDWLHCGLSAEIAARVSAKSFGKLKKPVERIGFAECQCPTQRHLENEFYPNAGKLVERIEDILGIDHCDLSNEKYYCYEDRFRGPF